MKSTTQGSSGTGRRLGLILLGYLLVAVGAVVLAPFELVRPTRFEWSLLGPWGGAPNWADLALNVVLFVPLGFLAMRLAAGRWAPWRVALLGACAALAIESLQLFIPGRFSTLSDVAANAVGAWVGALGARTLRRTIGGDSRIAGRLFLDLPLVGFLWLMVPLLWVDALSAGDTTLMFPAAAAAGVALAAASVSSTPVGRPVGIALVPLALAWSAVALAPLALITWTGALLAAATHLGAVLVAQVWLERLQLRDRRIEPRAVVVVLLLLLPFLMGTAMPGLVPGLGADTTLARQGILRWLAGVTAFTVLGYLLAEWHGRGRRRWPDTAVVPMVLAALLTPLADPGVGVAGRLLPAIMAAGIGALLFELQRQHVVALRRRAARAQPAEKVTNLAPEG